MIPAMCMLKASVCFSWNLSINDNPVHSLWRHELHITDNNPLKMDNFRKIKNASYRNDNYRQINQTASHIMWKIQFPSSLAIFTWTITFKLTQCTSITFSPQNPTTSIAFLIQCILHVSPNTQTLKEYSWMTMVAWENMGGRSENILATTWTFTASNL